MTIGFTGKVFGSLLGALALTFIAEVPELHAQNKAASHQVQDLERFRQGTKPVEAKIVRKTSASYFRVDSNTILNLDAKPMTAKPIEEAAPAKNIVQENVPVAKPLTLAELNTKLKAARTQYSAAKADLKRATKAKNAVAQQEAKTTMTAANQEIKEINTQIKALRKTKQKTTKHTNTKKTAGGSTAKASSAAVKK